MDKIRKLLSRLSRKERLQLQSFIDNLAHNIPFRDTHSKKLQGSDLFRARKGKFRVIFHYDQLRSVVIDSIKIRSENTYRDV